jgi:hypothetical protein
LVRLLKKSNTAFLVYERRISAVSGAGLASSHCEIA